MPHEEEGDRPSISVEADAEELVALGSVLGAGYEPATILVIDPDRSIVRVPHRFVRSLADVDDVDVLARRWKERSPSMRARDTSALAAMLAEMREFAGSAANGPGVVAYREA